MEGVLSSVGGKDGAIDTNCVSYFFSSSKNGFVGADGYPLTSGLRLDGNGFLIFSSTLTLINGLNGREGFSISISSCLLNSFDGDFSLLLLPFIRKYVLSILI